MARADATGFWQTAQTATHALLRAVSGLLLLQAGGMKVLGWLGGAPTGPPPPGSQIWIGAWLELVGGALLIVGAFTRWIAFVMSGMMAVAYFQFHQPQGAWPAQNGGSPAVLLCFACLLLWAWGGGAWSLDARLRKSG
jgi:putative oxidoreductase